MSKSLLQILTAKRDGQELQPEEIGRLVDRYVAGEFADYQMAAFAMATFIRGMSTTEIAALTQAMLRSGDVMSWPSGPPVVDKHSTGGIGDKVSLVLAPMLAACGLRVPMISGRGLGPTGGTLDKLESIPGFRTDLTIPETQQVVSDIGCCITGASERIAPADRRLYALRDVTGTVPSIPLITSSIMSKKLAEGLDALVLDVKVGDGAFMKSIDAARELAKSLCRTGNRLNVKTRFVITDMNQPLGRLIGNGVEVDESLAALRGEGPMDLMAVTIRLGVELLLATDVAQDPQSAAHRIQSTITSGKAEQTFIAMVTAQGGDLSRPRPRGPVTELLASQTGYVGRVANEQLGWVVIELGGGRKHLGDRIDFSVGLEMLKRIGDPIFRGEPWIRVFGSANPERQQRALQMLDGVVTISESPVPPVSLILDSGQE